MFTRLLFVLALVAVTRSVSVFAAEEATTAPLADLMKHPTYRGAWTGMVAGETLPAWVDDYAKTLDGPAVPAIPIAIDGEIYMLGFTCRPNQCGDNQLYVLFSPGGGKAWGLLLTGAEKKWLGGPDQSIQDAIMSGLE